MEGRCEEPHSLSVAAFFSSVEVSAAVGLRGGNVNPVAKPWRVAASDCPVCIATTTLMRFATVIH